MFMPLLSSPKRPYRAQYGHQVIVRKFQEEWIEVVLKWSILRWKWRATDIRVSWHPHTWQICMRATPVDRRLSMWAEITNKK